MFEFLEMIFFFYFESVLVNLSAFAPCVIFWIYRLIECALSALWRIIWSDVSAERFLFQLFNTANQDEIEEQLSFEYIPFSEVTA